MRASDGDGQCVDPGGVDERRRFGGIRTYPGGVRSVLSADLAEFCFQEQPAFVGPIRGRLCGGDVLGVFELGGVEHR